MKLIKLIILTFFILVLGFSVAYTTIATGRCVKGNCKNGFGKKVYYDSSSYEGHFQNWERDGKGTLLARNGKNYQGNWKAGKKNGYGKYSFSNGESYEGYFVEDHKEGKGKFTWSDGTALLCTWNNNEPNGTGLLIFPDSKSYSGFYKNGVIFSGEGIYIYDDRSRYLGEWKEGKRNGFGKLFTAEGVELKSGTWRDDTFVSN
ncbi:MAG: membrane-binding protein [Leptospiraceae bacterium]|nr:membrane-binding protein [Leptospiraceae bacterium]